MHTPSVSLSEESPQYADPAANYRSNGDWAAGVRPANVIETLEDVEWIFDPKNRSTSDKVRLVCRYCGTDRAVRSFTEGANWFRTHLCDGEGEQWTP